MNDKNIKREDSSIVSIIERLETNQFANSHSPIKKDRINSDDISLINTSESIGVGSYAMVYSGIYQAQMVAIKKCPYRTENEKKACKKEIAHLKLLSEKNIHVTKYYGYMKVDGYKCIVMQYVATGSLYNIILDNKTPCFSSKQLQVMMHIVATTLVGLKKYGIIHGDIKSSNVLIEYKEGEPHPILCDLGASEKMEEAYNNTEIRGAYCWAAPETLNDYIISFQSDVYSLGMLMWEAFAWNTKPYSNLATILHAMSYVKFGGRETVPEYVPPRISNLIFNMWKQSPDERPSIEDVVHELMSDCEDNKADIQQTI